jgi:hypothetical protein
MIEVVRCSTARFLKSIRSVLIIVLIVCLMFFSFFLYFFPDWGDRPLWIFYIIPGFFTLFYLGPVVLIYFNYLKINKDTIVEYDTKSLVYSIKSNKVNISFKNIDIINASIITGSRYLSRLGYIKLEVSGYEDYIYLTCLLFDTYKIPFRTNEAYEIALPYISKEDNLKIDKKKEIEATNNLISLFKNQYGHMTKDELKMIIKNKDSYQKAAVKAAVELLQEKSTTHNKMYKI